MRQGSLDEQVRAQDVGVENGVKVFDGRIGSSSGESSVAGVVDDDVNLAARELSDSGLDDVVAKCQRAGVALNSDGLDTLLLELVDDFLDSDLVGVVSNDDLR